jgi:hypothetical protein
MAVATVVFQKAGVCSTQGVKSTPQLSKSEQNPSSSTILRCLADLRPTQGCAVHKMVLTTAQVSKGEECSKHL